MPANSATTKPNMPTGNGCHIHLQGIRGSPQIQQLLKEGQQMGNKTANRVQSLTTAPTSKDHPLSTICGPRGRCPCASHGVSNPAPIMGEGRACTCRGQSQSFRQPGLGWRIQPPIWERRSLLEGRRIG
ncbi:hypothetical protein AMECASPLE_010433 [Ameca splendens]|uniref:Uncharacterized protein n=1 Tax=Ameca splendens TaxID=208324 RepID=A0ABV1A7N5_9TELE